MVKNKRKLIAYESGNRYGRLTLTGKTYLNLKSRRLFEVICDCGKIKWLTISSLISGCATSCGCRNIEVLIERSTKHGMAKRNAVHPVHKLWADMHQRCTNPNNPAFKNYGARGIFICEEWNDFTKFYKWCIENGWEKGLEIDRKDNNKGYSPDNCWFTTRVFQSRNRRSNIMVTAFGETKCAFDWFKSGLCTVSFQTLLNRIKKGFNSELSITSPQMYKF